MTIASIICAICLFLTCEAMYRIIGLVVRLRLSNMEAKHQPLLFILNHLEHSTAKAPLKRRIEGNSTG
jgi:hypothetical protein